MICLDTSQRHQRQSPSTTFMPQAAAICPSTNRPWPKWSMRQPRSRSMLRWQVCSAVCEKFSGDCYGISCNAARAQHATWQRTLQRACRGAPSASGSICHAGAGHDGVVVSWATGNAVILDGVPQNASLPEIGSAVCCFSAPPLCTSTQAQVQSPWLLSLKMKPSWARQQSCHTVLLVATM